jgi:rhodanese-related sulfurtransferase
MDAHTTYRQRDQLMILDIRQPHEWRSGRIEGAHHIPLTQLPRRLRDLDRHTPIVVVCRSGHRSGKAAKLLRALGFDAHNLDGGVNAWTAAGLPLITPDGQPGQVA